MLFFKPTQFAICVSLTLTIFMNEKEKEIATLSNNNDSSFYTWTNLKERKNTLFKMYSCKLYIRKKQYVVTDVTGLIYMVSFSFCYNFLSLK